MSIDFYVYIYLNPLKNFQPFYVGKGRKNRMFHHLREKSSKNIHKFNTIKQIKNITNQNPPIEIYSKNLTNKEACFLEEELIGFYGRVDKGTGILTNMTDGGEGGNGILWSEEMKRIASEKNIGSNNPNFDNRWSEEQRLRMSKRLDRLYKNGYKNPALGIKRNDLSERNKSTQGYVWIHNESKSKQIPSEELNKYLKNGYNKGMKKKK